jgi:adenylate cyclase class IV
MEDYVRGGKEPFRLADFLVIPDLPENNAYLRQIWRSFQDAAVYFGLRRSKRRRLSSPYKSPLLRRERKTFAQFEFFRF